jgi:hypothetical protein
MRPNGALRANWLRGRAGPVARLRGLLSLQENRRPTWRISASLGPKVAGVSEVWMTGTIRAGQPHLDRDDLGAVLMSGSVRTVVTRDTHPIAAAKVHERQPAEVADELVDQPRLYCGATLLRPPRDEQCSKRSTCQSGRPP